MKAARLQDVVRVADAFVRLELEHAEPFTDLGEVCIL